MWILDICIFTSTSENGVLILHIKKIILKIKKKMQSTVNTFAFFIEFMSKQRNPLSKQSLPFSPTPPFLEKIFHCHPYCQIRGSQFPLYKGEGGFELCKIKGFLLALSSY